MAITTLALAVLWLSLGAPLLRWQASVSGMLAEQRRLAKQMAADAAALPVLRAAMAARYDPAATRLLGGASDSVAAAQLQQQVEAIAAGAGVALGRVAVLPVEPAGRYNRIALRISLTATWPVLLQLLHAITTAAPRMVIEDPHLRAVLAATRTQQINADLSVVAFRPIAP